MRMAEAREEPVGKAATILRAARQAFLASGFGAVSMDAIAREAAVSKATVYAHFNSKEALFGAVVADVAEQHFGGFTALELDPRDIEASLTTIARRFLDLVLSPEAVALNRILIGEVTRFPALSEAQLLALPVFDADGALALEQDACRMRLRLHAKVGTFSDVRMDVAARGAPALATFLRAFGQT